MKKLSMLTYLRMILSGAIAGAALFSINATPFGLGVGHVEDLLGGLIGAAVVAIGFKMAHLV